MKLRRDLKAEVERRGIIEAEARTGEVMEEEVLEFKTRRREEAEPRLVVATEALERAANEAKWRDVEDAARREEEGERLEVQRLVVERRNGGLSPLRGRRPNVWRPIYGRSPRYSRSSSYGRRPSDDRRQSYNDLMPRQWRKGRDTRKAALCS